MSIELDSNRSWLKNQPDLHIKRYLSQTRTYYRDGIWVRDYFKAIFPEIVADSQNELFYDLNSLDPKCSFEKRVSLKSSKIPKDLINQFEIAANEFKARLAEGHLSFNEEVSSESFTLPDPRHHPDLYFITTDEYGFRLIVFWGLESNHPQGDLKIDDIVKVLHSNFKGRASIKSKPVKSRPVSKSKKFEFQSAPSKVEKKTKPPKIKSKRLKIAGPEKKPKPQKKKPTPKPQKKKLAPKSRKKFNWNKLRWLRKTTITAIVLIIGFFVLTIISSSYLGSDLIVTELTTGKEKRAIELGIGQELILPNGTIIHQGISKKTKVLLGPFPKPGNYRLIKRTPELNEEEQIHILYSNARNDHSSNPVASLALDRIQIHEGEFVAATVYQSFHKNIQQSDMSYQLSWGDTEDSFESISDSENSMNHTYSETGAYRVTLLVKDSFGKWDYDTIVIEVVDAGAPLVSAKNMPPVPDVEIVSIIETDATYLVKLDISDSYDIDGSLKSISIHWGDKSKPEDFEPKSDSITHVYRKSTTRAAIRVIVVDLLGLQSAKPAILNLDFQSAQMNEPAQFNKEIEIIHFKYSVVESSSSRLKLEKSISDNPYKNKQLLHFSLQNLINPSSQAFMNVRWELKSDHNEKIVIFDSREIEVLAVDGSYHLSLFADTPDGEHHELVHRFSVRIKDSLSLPIKATNWLAKIYSDIN